MLFGKKSEKTSIENKFKDTATEKDSESPDPKEIFYQSMYMVGIGGSIWHIWTPGYDAAMIKNYKETENKEQKEYNQ